MECFLIFIIIVLLIIIIFIFKRLKYCSKYSVFLEDEYFNLINLLISSDDDEKIKLLNKAKQTSLYKKIRWDTGDNIEHLRMQYEDNNFVDYPEDPHSKIGT
jgi:uncharacterized membrane protein YfhO